MNTHIDIMHDALLDLRNSIRKIGTLTEIDVCVEDRLLRMLSEIGDAVSSLDSLYSSEVLDVEKPSK